MRAALTLPVGIAGVDQPTLSLAGVDLAEAGGGEGDEQPRMAGHGVGDALAAFQPSGKELIAVGLVGRRAGRAHTEALRLPQAFRRVASGSRSVAYRVRRSSVAGSI